MLVYTLASDVVVGLPGDTARGHKVVRHSNRLEDSDNYYMCHGAESRNNVSLGNSLRGKGRPAAEYCTAARTDGDTLVRPVPVDVRHTDSGVQSVVGVGSSVGFVEVDPDSDSATSYGDLYLLLVLVPSSRSCTYLARWYRLHYHIFARTWCLETS